MRARSEPGTSPVFDATDDGITMNCDLPPRSGSERLPDREAGAISDGIVVSVICAAFNQERFIAMALEGFLRQETSFPTEILVHDDASTDSTASVIRHYETRYPGRFRCFYQQVNQYQSIGNNIVHEYLIPKTSGAFIAICEGDDYWTDRRKLEKQVAFMRRQPEVAMSCHAARVNHYGGPSRYGLHRLRTGPLIPPKVVVLGGGGLYPTCSAMFRRDVLVDFPEFFRGLPIADSLWALNALRKGAVGYMDEVMAVYNAGVPDSWSQRARHRPLSETLGYLRRLEEARAAFDQLTNGQFSRWIKRRCSRNRLLALIAAGVGPDSLGAYRDLRDGMLPQDRLRYTLRSLEARILPGVRGGRREGERDLLKCERAGRPESGRATWRRAGGRAGERGCDVPAPDRPPIDERKSAPARERSMPRRPTVLFLARSFPPISSIASVRSKNVAKHLTRLGWTVRVVTPDPRLVRRGLRNDTAAMNEVSNVDRIETGYKWKFLLHGFFEGAESGLAYLCSRLGRRAAGWLSIEDGAGWVNPVIQACSDIRAGEVDVVLSTGSPYLSFIAARSLARRLDCPYVLDYRDPWTTSPHAREAPIWIRSLEKRLLGSASAVTVVSPSWTTYFESLAPGTKVTTITNGYDRESMAAVEPTVFDSPTLVYAGGFYPPKRTLVPVFRALGIARRAVPRLEFLYLGPDQAAVSEWARSEGVERFVRSGGTVRRAEVWAAMKGAVASVVVTSVSQEAEPIDRGILPGKLYESIGLRSPVLLIAPEGTDARTVIAEAGAGVSASGAEIEMIATHMIRLSRRVTVPTWDNAERYSWGEVVQDLDSVLRQVTTTSRSPNLPD